MIVWVDGALRGSAGAPRGEGVAPFETMGARGADAPLWPRHLARLSASAAALGIPFAPTPALRAAATDVLLKNGHAEDVLRLSLEPVAGRVHVVLASRSRSPVGTVQLLPTILARPAGAPPADVKAAPRRFYDLVRQQAQDGDADDGIVVGADGALLEAALGNLWMRLEGVWVTPPLDGRVLPGVARAVLLEAAAAAGAPFVERHLTFADLHAAEAIAHSNAVHGPRPACLVGDRAAVELVDAELGALWRGALEG